MTRVTVHYTGNVQGVGFRYTTTQIAERHDVAGYVQNLPDGSVRLVAEGKEADVAAFLDDVTQMLSRHIENQSKTTTDATGEFGDPKTPDTFAVKY